ncbi:MAG: hypothetical protein ABEI97_02825 [Candidatus Nanohaloarchaea archaeon]
MTDAVRHFIHGTEQMADTVEWSLNHRTEIAKTYNDWLEEELGVDTDEFDFWDIEELMVDTGIIETTDSDHVTLGAGRQIDAPRFEKIGLHTVGAEAVRREAEARGIAADIRPNTYESDGWMNYSPEKRSYVTLPLITGRGVRDVPVASALNNQRMDSVTVDIPGVAGSEEEAADIRHTLETYFDVDLHDIDGEPLPELHRRIDQTGVQGRGDYGEFYNAYLNRLVDATEPANFPDKIKIPGSYVDGVDDTKWVTVEQEYTAGEDGPDNPHWYTATFEGVDVNVNINKVLDDAVLEKEGGYRHVVLPLSAHPNLVYITRDGMPGDEFAPSEPYNLEARLQDEHGMEALPFLDVEETVVVGSDGETVFPGHLESEIQASDAAEYVDGPGDWKYSTVFHSFYPGAHHVDQIDSARERVYGATGVGDADVHLPDMIEEFTRDFVTEYVAQSSK